MKNLSPFCSCENFDCPIHPTKHDKGCAPCIAKNLRLNEVPTCFFNKVDGNENRRGDTFIDFADVVKKANQKD